MKTRSQIEVRELSEPECFALLATATTGHLAITHLALPLVLPVRIGLVGKELSVKSLLGEVVPITSGAVVALEVGGISDDPQHGWIVEVRGFLVATNNGVGIDPPRQFAAANREYRLSTDEVNGWSPIEIIADGHAACRLVSNQTHDQSE
jgi:hypothetical protein